MASRLLDLLALPREDETKFSEEEKRARYVFDRGFRFALAYFISHKIYDFLFGPIWMHGYVWSLNLPIDLDMAEKSAGLIVKHQEDQVSYLERKVHTAHLILFLWLLLERCGFAARSQRVKTLLTIALANALITGLVRTQQYKHRLFPALHEGVYAFVVVFVAGLILTLRLKSDPVHRFPEPEPENRPEKLEENKAVPTEKEVQREAEDSDEEAEYELVDKKND